MPTDNAQPSRKILKPVSWPPVIWRCLLAILILDVVKHALLMFADPQPPVMDARGYWDLGLLVSSGDWVWRTEPIAYRTPGYPALLAMFQLSGGRSAMMLAIAFQHVCVMSTSAITAWICGRLTRSGWAAVIAYGLSAVCLTRAWSANLLLTETVFTLLLTILLTADVYYREKPMTRRSLLVGIVLGATTLTRPVTSLFWIPLMISWLIDRKSPRSLYRRVGHAAAMVAMLFVLIAPWYVRNWAVFGEPFLTSFLGRNLWTVTFQDGAGAGLVLPDAGAGHELHRRVRSVDTEAVFTDTWSVSNALRRSGLNDHESDQLMLQTCIDANRSKPVLAANRGLRRTVNFWRCVANPFPRYRPTTDAENLGQFRWNSQRLADLFHALSCYAPSRSLRMNELVLVAVLTGAVMILIDSRLRAYGIIWGLTLLYFNLITAAVEIPAYRYRMVLEPIMIMMVVIGFIAGCQRIRLMRSA